MTTRTNIEREAWGDIRFAMLARFVGFPDSDFALIKCARIWAWQTEHFTREKPTYVVSTDLVDTILGEHGAAALVRAQLGEEVPEGIRMRGSLGRIEWLFDLNERGKKATAIAAAKRNAQHKEVPAGIPTGSPQGALPVPILAPVLSEDPPGDLEPQRESEAPRARGRARFLSGVAHVPVPEDWEPEASPANARAAAKARARKVSPEHELEQFRDWARRENKRFADLNAAWRHFLRGANPTDEHVISQIARDRERADRAQRARAPARPPPDAQLPADEREQAINLAMFALAHPDRLPPKPALTQHADEAKAKTA